MVLKQSYEDYEKLLADIKTNNYPLNYAVIFTDTQIYDINLNTRVIDAPEFLSMERDHHAETIYFRVDRFVDHIDLSTKTCIVRYVNAKGDAYLYIVPFYDVTTDADEGKMLFPWCLSGAATVAPGPVKFSIQFYDTDSNGNITYSLNTKVAQGRVLYGMNLDQELAEDYKLTASAEQQLLDKISKLTANNAVYWDKLD